MSGLPLQENCDLSDPEQHLLWSYAFLPMKKMKGVPLVTHPEVLKDWSRHQYRCGFRHHPELQEIDLVPPAGGIRAFGPPGVWEPIAEAAEKKAANQAAESREFEELRSELLTAMPDLAKKLEGMSEEDKAAARKDAMASLQEQMKQMQVMYDRLKNEEEG